jgi:hypothetical protein
MSNMVMEEENKERHEKKDKKVSVLTLFSLPGILIFSLPLSKTELISKAIRLP